MTKPTKSISPLRQRMLENMTMRELDARTQKDCIRDVVNSSNCLKRSRHTAGAGDLRQYQLHLSKQNVSSVTINLAIAGLRFFINITLDRAELARTMRYLRGALGVWFEVLWLAQVFKNP